MRLSLASLLVLAVAGGGLAIPVSASDSARPASSGPVLSNAANVWSAPDSTRLAPWKGRAGAPTMATIPLEFVYNTSSPNSHPTDGGQGNGGCGGCGGNDPGGGPGCGNF